MTPSHRISFVLGLLALAPVASVHAAVVAAPNFLAQEAKPERYVRTTAATKLYNVADKKGLAVASLPAGTLLAVYADQTGWLSVEPPQGLNVWVYGQFLRATAQSGVAEVTGDGVRMRPKPSSSVDSFPLEQQLFEGDRVRVLGRNDAKKSLREDWVQIVTPPGVRGWVATGDTGAIEAGLDVRTSWMDAVKKSTATVALYDLRDGQSVAAGAAPAGAASTAAATPPKPDAAPAQGSWDAAERAYEAAKVAAAADWKSVRAGFQSYLDQNPNGASASTAKLRLEQISYHEEIARLKSDAALQEVQRQKMLAEAQAQLEEAALSQDPLWGRFQARGWLRRDENQPGRFLVQWGGRIGAEVTCGSGRYDLALFEGSEIGVLGATTRTASSADRPMRIDATRIEILSAPSGR
ncbi:MAG: SH3 domain-containing protein [Planctomycetota bacterium]|nr:SH3 domain-containing protein [Planctomycetota bacterium]